MTTDCNSISKTIDNSIIDTAGKYSVVSLAYLTWQIQVMSLESASVGAEDYNLAHQTSVVRSSAWG